MILHSPSKQNKGFVALLLVGIVAVVALGLAGYEWYSNHNQKLGAVVTDTQLTDTLGTFRVNTNTNIDNINAELNGVSTTIGTYGNLVTLNSPLPVTNGGTGTTTAPSNAQFLSASGTSPAWKTITWGSGLNSTTTATSVQVSTQGVDTTANYSWTGLHTFTSLTSASTTLNGTTNIGTSTFSVLPIGATPFGGTGALGALVATSTAVNVALSGNVSVFNYSSISITGTGSIAFTSTSTLGNIVILKSQGACTITASSTAFNMSGLGTPGGAHGGSGGDGGAGAGSIIMECGGAWNFGASSTISVAGINGGNATGNGGASGNAGSLASSSLSLIESFGGSAGLNGTNGAGATSTFYWNAGFSAYPDAIKYRSVAFVGSGGGGGGGQTSCGGGGGGGAGGFFLALYGTLTANSGTVLTTGGTGGTDNNGACTAGGGGGANASANGSTAASTGGNGATGLSMIVQRTF